MGEDAFEMLRNEGDGFSASTLDEGSPTAVDSTKRWKVAFIVLSVVIILIFGLFVGTFVKIDHDSKGNYDLQQSFLGLEQKLDKSNTSVYGKNQDMQNNIEHFDEEIEDVKKSLQDMTEDMEQSFSDLDKKVDSMNSSIQSQNLNLHEDVQQSLLGLEERIDGLNTSMNDQHQDLEKLLSDINTKVGNGSAQDHGQSTIDETSTTSERSSHPDWYWISHDSQSFAYKLFTESVDYATARSKCQQQQARLASVGMRIASVRADVIFTLLRRIGEHAWLGLDDLETPGEFVWADGVNSTSSNTDWAPGEPSNAAERCAQLSTWADHDFRLNDSTCHSKYFYLCEVVRDRD